MCGRYTLTPSATALIDAFGVPAPEVAPRFNIAPTQPVLVMRVRPGTCEIEATHMHWGLIPSWAKDPSIGNRMINARAETAASKPSFRNALKYRRCLIPASGFYEWQKLPGKRPKQAYHINFRDGRLFAFAGLWEHSTGPNGEEVDSCVILTTEANECLAPFHDRMPVIIRPEDFNEWLDPAIQDAKRIEHLLACFPAEEMVVAPVGPTVNSPRNEGPQCQLPL